MPFIFLDREAEKQFAERRSVQKRAARLQEATHDETQP